MTHPTVGNYLKYLKESYLIREVPLFSYKNLDRQKIRKYYAIDVAFISNHDYALGSPGYGWRLENVIALELMRRINPESDQLFYLKKNKSYEVDFVVVKSGNVVEPIRGFDYLDFFIFYDFYAGLTLQHHKSKIIAINSLGTFDKSHKLSIPKLL